MGTLPVILKWFFRLCLCGWIATFFLVDQLPDSKLINPQLYPDPIQKNIAADVFNITYKDVVTKVTPVAEYELHGLVVSHNDPAEWYRFDLTHDKKSLDTRDLCVIWGDNVKKDDFKEISYTNTDWSCVVKWKHAVSFNGNQLSNNHLITDNEEIRKKIGELNIGDQIVIRGKLVNYSEDRWNGFVRNTSQTRTDTGNGACEIIYVSDLEVIDSHNHIWAALHKMLLYVMLVTVCMRFALFFQK